MRAINKLGGRKRSVLSKIDEIRREMLEKGETRYEEYLAMVLKNFENGRLMMLR
jgi:hypothetical protein